MSRVKERKEYRKYKSVISTDLYKTAWKTMRSHYFINVVVLFIVGVILRDGYNFASDWTYRGNIDSSTYMLTEDRKTNYEILREFIMGQDINPPPQAETDAEKYTMGYFAVIVNEVTDSGSLGFGVLNGINKIVFHGKVGESVVIFIMVTVSGFFWIFVKNLAKVGRCRYFMEQRLYRYTSADRLLFPLKIAYTRRTVKTMFLRSMRMVLWNFTLIGGIVKHYEYYMMPYILAENPTMSAEEAFSLSKQLMKGEKWHAFFIDVTLVPLALLDGLTFHISSLFLLNPYRECLYCEFYSRLRDTRKGSLQGGELLYDTYLSVPADSSSYPDSHCPTPFLEHRKWLTTDYNKDYGGDTPILFFFFFSLIGWTWEVFFYLLNDGSFINRGTMTGPWLPIYGLAGWIIIYGLRPLRKNPPAMFIGTLVVCGSVEYFTSWLLEKLMHQRWWDYEGYFMNLHGRICLEGLLVFGFAGVAMTYFIAPVAENLLHKIPKKVRRVICTVLIILFFTDLIWSIGHPNTGDGITEGFK